MQAASENVYVPVVMCDCYISMVCGRDLHYIASSAGIEQNRTACCLPVHKSTLIICWKKKKKKKKKNRQNSNTQNNNKGKRKFQELISQSLCIVIIWAQLFKALLRGSCKKFCHWVRITSVLRFIKHTFIKNLQSIPPAGLGGSVGCAVRLETRRSRVQPPPRSATFFRAEWSWNIFYGHSLPSADSRRAVVSFWRKNVHNTG